VFRFGAKAADYYQVRNVFAFGLTAKLSLKAEKDIFDPLPHPKLHQKLVSDT
jgi:hypothetical protein